MKNIPGLDIFVSASLKHPELNAVKYEADKELIMFEFALETNLELEARKSFVENVENCLQLFVGLNGIKPTVLKINCLLHSGFTFLYVYRDIKSLSEEEITLLVDLVKREFNHLLIKDRSSIIAEEQYKRRIMKNLINKMNKGYNSSTNFFAYREEGKVFVFNK